MVVGFQLFQQLTRYFSQQYDFNFTSAFHVRMMCTQLYNIVSERILREAGRNFKVHGTLMAVSSKYMTTDHFHRLKFWCLREQTDVKLKQLRISNLNKW
jgi:hypothetical protein